MKLLSNGTLCAEEVKTVNKGPKWYLFDSGITTSVVINTQGAGHL